MKLFGILNKEQGMRKLNDEGIFRHRFCPRKSEAALRFSLI
jgi:hypothetical protein